MSAKKVQIMLDLLLNLKSDKSQAAQIAKEMEQNLKNINPKISIDSDKFRKGITDILGEFDKLEKSALDFDKILSNIDIDFDSDQAEQAMKKLAEMMKNAGDNLGDLDLSKFEEALGSLGDEDIEQIGEKLKEAFDNFDANSLKKQIKGIEDETELMKLNVEKATAEYNKQRSTVALLAKAGKENTDEYKEALAELKKRGDELKKIKKAEEDIGKAVEGTKEKMSVMNKLSQFGLASEGIQNFAQSVNEVSAPFMELDKATQAMKTLGPEAKELSGELRTVSVQMAKDLPFSAGQFQEAMGNAMASGIKGGVEGLSGFAETAAKLATGGMAELPAVVQGLGATLNAFGASSSEAGQYADWMFNIVNAGVTTIDELNQYLSGVTPTAASMGVAFKDVGGALALMTQKGVPTASAVTKLNAALIEMAKPSAGIQQALTAVGISTEDFAKQIKEKGLTSALQTLDTGFKKLGKSATQMFSSSEAGAAFNVLMGDVNMLNDTMDAVANTAGSTQAAYDEMAQSIEVRTKQMKAQFDSFVISVIDSTGVIGEYTMVAGQVFSQLSPTITALAGFKTLLPTEAIGDFVKSLLTKLVPGLFATAAAETAAGTAGTTAGASTAAAWAAAMLPLLAIVAVAGAIVGAFKLIADATHETAKEQLESAKATEDSLKSQQKTLQAQKERKQANLELIKSYEELGKKSNRTKDEEEQFRQMQVKISQAFPGVISGSKTFAENMANLKNAVEKGKGEVQKLDKQLSELDKNLVKARTVTLQSEVNVSKENIEDQLQDAFSSVSWSWDGAQEWIFGTSNAREMAEDSIKQYTDAIYQAQNSSQLAEAGAKFKMALWNDKAFEAVPEEMKAKLVGSIEDMMLKQGAVIDQQNKLNTEKMQKGIKEAFKDGVVSEADIKAISDKTKVPLEEVQKYYDELKTKAKAEKLGDILKQSAEIKGNLDGSQKLDELVKQFENAKTDVEKASIAEAIKKQAPDAIKATGSVITAEGKLVNTYSVVTDKIKESSDAQKERYSNNLSSKQQEFINTILQESDAYGKNIEEMNRLKAERDNLASQGLDTSQIDQQINALGAKNQAFTNEVLNNIIKWESQGQDTTEVYDQVAKSLGKSPEEVKKLVEAQKKSIKQAEQQKTLAQQIGDNFAKAQQELNKSIGETQNALAGLYVKKMKGQKLTTEEVEEWNKLVKSGKEAVKDRNLSNKAGEAAAKIIGNINAEQVSLLEQAKKQAEFQKSVLDNRLAEYDLALNTQTVLENRTKDSYDELLFAKEQLNTITKQKDAYLEAFKAKKLVSDIKADGTIVFGAKVESSDKEEIRSIITDMNKQILESSSSLEEIKLKVQMDESDLKAKELDFLKKQAEWEVEIGLKDETDYSLILEKLKENHNNIVQEKIHLEDELNKLDIKHKEDQSKFNEEAYSDDIDKAKKYFESQLKLAITKNSEERGIYEKMNAEILALGDKADSKKIKAIEKKYSKELENAKKNSVDIVQVAEETSNKLKEIGLDSSSYDLNKVLAKYKPIIDAEEISNAQIVSLYKERESELSKLGKKATAEDKKKITDKYDALINEAKKYDKATEQTYIDMNNEISKILESLPEETRKSMEVRFKQQFTLLKKQHLDVKTAEIDNQKEQNDIVEAAYQERLKIIDEFYEEQKSKIEEKYDEQLDDLKEFRDAYAESLAITNQNADDKEMQLFEDKLNEKLKKLDEYREQDVISEEEYEERKTKLEEDAAKKRAKMERERRVREQMNQKFLNSMEIQAEKYKNAEVLEEDKKANDKKLEILEKKLKDTLDQNGTNFEEVKQLQTQLNELELKQIKDGYDAQREEEINSIKKNLDSKMKGVSKADKETLKQLTQNSQKIEKALKENTDIATAILEEGQKAVSTAMAKMFAGDSQGAVDALKGTFGAILGTTAEYLRKQVDATILKFFLDYFDKPEAKVLPWYVQLALLPAIQALASGAIHGIADPIINSVASFSTGGRIDEPTLAVVGDASRLGGLNREWVFRDEQLQQVVNSALSYQNNAMAQKLDRIAALLESQELSATLKGTDIRLAQRRTQNAVDRRAR